MVKVIDVKIKLPDGRIGKGVVDKHASFSKIINEICTKFNIPDPETYYLKIVPDSMQDTLHNLTERRITLVLGKKLREEDYAE